jgi:hypothetical protein
MAKERERRREIEHAERKKERKRGLHFTPWFKRMAQTKFFRKTKITSKRFRVLNKNFHHNSAFLLLIFLPKSHVEVLAQKE